MGSGWGRGELVLVQDENKGLELHPAAPMGVASTQVPD